MNIQYYSYTLYYWSASSSDGSCMQFFIAISVIICDTIVSHIKNVSFHLETTVSVMMYVIGVIVLILMIVMGVSFGILCFWIRNRNKM